MAVALPFRFDTSGVVVTVLRGGLGLLLVLVAGAAYTLIVSRRPGPALGLLIVAAIVAYFGRLFAANLIALTGTITADAVTVEPVRVYGIRLAGPAGTFPIRRFNAVRVERASPPVEVYGGPHARVYLAGREATPDILVARAAIDEGKVLGRGLAAALGLPIEEPPVPY